MSTQADLELMEITGYDRVSFCAEYYIRWIFSTGSYFTISPNCSDMR